MIEPEEIIEAAIIAKLAELSATGVPVEGTLAPAAPGEVKVSNDTFINVAVDQAQPLLHSASPQTTTGYNVRISVHVAFADSKEGVLFRDVCRSVREILTACQGDNCGNLSTPDWDCFDFMVETTNTDLEDTETGGAMRKIYNATISGRVKNTTTTTTTEGA